MLVNSKTVKKFLYVNMMKHFCSL